MTPEERHLLAGLFERTRAAAGNPRDREAEAMIADSVRQQPYAPYLLAQTVIVQEEALKAAAGRIEELETRLRMQDAGVTGGFLDGSGRSPLGSGSSASSSVPLSGGRWSSQPRPPAAAGGPWSNVQTQQQPGAGGSFLRGALGAAAGIAGGVLLANSLSGLFGGDKNALGIGSGLDKAGAQDTGDPMKDISETFQQASWDEPASDSSFGWGGDDGGSDI
jgi:hypothetical protein